MESSYKDIVKENMDNLPILRSILSEFWINNNLESDNLFPIIGLLIYYPTILEKIEYNLYSIGINNIKEKQLKYIVTSLKEEDVFGIISEIDVWAFLKRNNLSIVYNANNDGPDFTIKIDLDEIFVEVSTLNLNKSETIFNKDIDKLCKKLKVIKQPFHVSISFESAFNATNIDELYRFILQKAEEEKNIREGEEKEIGQPFKYINRISLRRYAEKGKVIVGRGYIGNDIINKSPCYRINAKLKKESKHFNKESKNVIIVNLFAVDNLSLYYAINGYVDGYIIEDNLKEKGFYIGDNHQRVNLIIGYKSNLNCNSYAQFHPNPYKPF